MITRTQLYIVTPAHKSCNGFGNSSGNSPLYTLSEISKAAQKAKTGTDISICYDGPQGGFICCVAGAELLRGLREVVSVKSVNIPSAKAV